MHLMRSFVQNVLMDSGLIQEYVLLLIPSAQNISFNKLLNYANHALQDIIYHKEPVLKIKLAASILVQFAQVA